MMCVLGVFVIYCVVSYVVGVMLCLCLRDV